MYVFQDFHFENDIVIKVGNAADLGTHWKNVKFWLTEKATRRQKFHFD